MPKYEYNITQENTYQFTIEADSEEGANKIFDQYIVDDFGEPIASHLTYDNPIELEGGQIND